MTISRSLLSLALAGVLSVLATPSAASAQTMDLDVEEQVSTQPMVQRIADAVDEASGDDASLFTVAQLESPNLDANEAMLQRVVRRATVYTRRLLSAHHIASRRLAFGERVTVDDAERLAQTADEIMVRVEEACGEGDPSVCDGDGALDGHAHELCCTPEGNDARERSIRALQSLHDAANELARLSDDEFCTINDDVISEGLLGAFEARLESERDDQARLSLVDDLRRFTVTLATQARRELRAPPDEESAGKPGASTSPPMRTSTAPSRRRETPRPHQTRPTVEGL